MRLFSNIRNAIISNKKRANRVVAALLVASMIITPTLTMAADAEGGLLGLSISKLGESGTMYSIYTAEHLKEALDKNVDDDYSNMFLKLEADIHMADLPDWTPVGTQEKPFNGVIDGSNFKITGLGSDKHPSLFGYVKNATITNLNIITARALTDANPYFGLLKVAENSNISNCDIKFEAVESTLMRSMLSRSAIVEDTGWKVGTLPGEGSSTTPIVTTAGQLWALASLVNNGKDYSNIVVEIGADIDCRQQNFIGIGNAKAPFKGSIKGNGKTISNLKIESSSPISTGFINYADGSGSTTPSKYICIEDLTFENVSIMGGDRTGTLLGYGKDVQVKNVAVRSGSVSGQKITGGIVGELYATCTNTTSNANIPSPFIGESYSMADVSGTHFVGGIIGSAISPTNANNSVVDVVVEKCFTTGSITAGNNAGGIAGYLGTNTYILSTGKRNFTIIDSASMATIKCDNGAGGILSVGAKRAISANTPKAVNKSYFSGQIIGNNYLGGVIGQYGGVSGSYVSGRVSSNIAFTLDTRVKSYPIVGYFGGSGATAPPYIIDTYTAPDTIHRPGNRYNVGMDSTYIAYRDTPRSNSTYNLDTGGDVHTLKFANAADGSSYFSGTEAPTGFTAHNLNIPTGNTAGITGQFPTLDAFAGINSAFDLFSDISTDSSLTHFPTEFYINKNKEATVDGSIPNGTAYMLPSAMDWTIVGGGEIDDLTLESLKNSITISGDKIIFEEIPQQELQITLKGEKSGISLQYTVNIHDGALRPIFGEEPEAFKTDISSSTPNISVLDNLYSIAYGEEIRNGGTTVPSIPIDLEVYSDGSYAPSKKINTITGGVQLTLLGDNRTVKIDITGLEFGKYYKMSFGSNAVSWLEDTTGNKLDTAYYFQTVGNSAPKLSFDTSYPLYADNKYDGNETNSAKDRQIVGMEESDFDYAGILDGVIVENPESAIDLSAQPAGSYVLTKVHSTMEGKNGYPMLGANKEDTFHAIPGEYEFKYQIPDKEDSTLSSNQITRIYRVYSKPQFTQGGENYSMLNASFNTDDMIMVYKDMEQNKITAAEAMEKALIKRYLSNPSSVDYLAAYVYSYNGKKMDIDIKFDTSAITDDIFKDGFKQTIAISADTLEKTMVLTVDSSTPDYEIVVSDHTYHTKNTYTRSEVSHFFNAYVIQKSTGQRVDKGVKYDYSKVSPYKYSVPQEITIYMIQPEEAKNMNGMDMTVSTKVSIVIEKELKYKHPEDKEDYATIFWDETSEKIRKAAPERTLSYELSYEEASRTPADIFRIVKNRNGGVVTFTLPTGIQLELNAGKVDTSKIEGLTYLLAVEPMYDMYIGRDVGDEKVQQFFTADEVIVPGTIEVRIPLNKDMPKEGLKLYRIDEKTKEYVLVQDLTKVQIKDEKIVLQMTKLQGRYVVTKADLAGKEVGGTKKK